MSGLGGNGSNITGNVSISDTKGRDGIVVCYAPNMIRTSGVLQGDNPLDFSLPLFILQVTVIVLITRCLVFILKPLRQPRVVSEIIGGVLLGPSVLGRSKQFAETLFPLRSTMILETMSHIGLLYFLFLVGVEMDLTVIKRTGKKAFTIAISGLILPFIIGASYAIILGRMEEEVAINKNTPNQGKVFFLFSGVALSVTAFPVLARILAELKLLSTELGKVAMSAALVNDILAWTLLSLSIALGENRKVSLASLWVILSTIGFVLFCIFVVRPAIRWIIRRTPEGESFNEFYISLILTGVMVCGFITDTIGSHSIVGAFVFGLIIPNGPLGTQLLEKLEDFVSGLLIPLFFTMSGLRTKMGDVGAPEWGYAFFTFILASLGKVGGTLLICLYYKMQISEGLTLGLLMNTKGLIEIIVLNVGRDQEVMDDNAFALLVLMTTLMTSIIMPIVHEFYRPARRYVPYKLRTLQSSKPDSELRILACVHTPRNVPTIISLLEASHPTKKSPISVYALHLVELTGRASAMLIVHENHNSGRPAVNRTQAQSDHIINAFENYEQHMGGVSVKPLTAISPYSTMHEDICNLAEDKRVAFILVPFHKQQTVDGGMEATNPAFRAVNQNVLANAPCSVGILVDRGLGGGSRVASSHTTHHIAVLFFGGPDDREALSYARRMSEHPEVNITVLHFIAGDNAVEPVIPSNDRNDIKILNVITDNDREKLQDDHFINEFRMKNINSDSIVYREMVVNNGEETVAVIRSMDNIYDLFIVGRGQGMISPLTAGLTDWSECPELGAIGDLLSSSDFAATVSVLVVQQYVDNELDTLYSPGQHGDDDEFNMHVVNQWTQSGQGHGHGGGGEIQLGNMNLRSKKNGW
ncbi:cation/H(+) antiporter 15-like [Macadamia integrifolia]|uniref:cation/H(+) antiporter 15-like n=1 Tax=Macadamia integrifolia TaxID=60698 RepID=UPI001C4E78A4|nr:cation/H(+) antiporter 15-like [Macadamia integrifolia]